MKRAGRIVVMLVAPVMLAGCAWAQSRFGPEQNAFNPGSGVTPANAPQLAEAFRADGTIGTPLVRNANVFVRSNGANRRVQVYDASGVTNCDVKTHQCTPLWVTDREGGFAMAISGATLFVAVAGVDDALAAYDANGVTDCSGTPKTCRPLFILDWPETSDLLGVVGITVAGDVVYAHVTRCPPSGCIRGAVAKGEVFAWDARGVTNCSGTPAACQPLWRGVTNLDDFNGPTAPTVAAGKVYLPLAASSGSRIAIFDAAGNANCGGTPKVCTEIASVTSTSVSPHEAPVWGGSLFTTSIVGNTDIERHLRAYDANGASAPTWSSDLEVNASPPALAHGLAYITANVGPQARLLAYDATGSQGCSGTPNICTPRFSGVIGNAVPAGTRVDIVVAGDVVYVSTPTRVRAFDANGAHGCSGTPTVCQPVWSLDGTVSGHPVVVNDHVFLDDAAGLVAYTPQ
jgi:hypothetical protein